MAVIFKVFNIVIVVFVSILATLALVLSQGDALTRSMTQYPTGSRNLVISGVAQERAPAVLGAFGRLVDTEQAAFVRVDNVLSSTDSSVTGLRIGIMARPDALPRSLDFHFLGTAIMDRAKLRDLLAAEPTKTIGLDGNAADVIAPMPSLTFAPRVAVLQLPELVTRSGTINGTYRILGLDDSQFAALVVSLTSVTSQSEQSLRGELQGGAATQGLALVFVTGLLAATTVLLATILVFAAVRVLRVLGVHLLVGRSRGEFALSVFRPVLVAAACTVPVSMALTFVMAPAFGFTASLVLAAFGGALVGPALVTVCVGLASLVLLAVKPVDAIQDRYSKRLLTTTVAVVYVVIMAGLTSAFYGLDAPLKSVSELRDVAQSWKAFQDEEILYSEAPGNDPMIGGLRSPQHVKDFYDWYRSIAGTPGVTLVNTVYYGQDILTGWTGVYKSVPVKPFWYMAASPSYLRSQGVNVSQEALTRAERGERIFLMPKSLKASESTALQGWLRETSRVKGKASITTEYVKDPQVGFLPLASEDRLFTWNTDPSRPYSSSEPVILLLTPQNMIPFESESLSAVGLENSYVKLSRTAAERVTTPQYLAQFHLDDNQPTFLPVSDFIAGLTKTIQQVIQLFGVVIGLLALFTITLVGVLTSLYSNLHLEEIAVKRMLGHGLIGIFWRISVFVSASTGMCLGAALLLRSATAAQANLMLLMVQVTVLLLLARRYTRLQLNTVMKS